MSYWAQFSYREIVETHGVEFYNFIKDDTDSDQENDDTNSDQDFYCNRCLDAGCYMCDLK